jgi:hypothetical protein
MLELLLHTKHEAITRSYRPDRTIRPAESDDSVIFLGFGSRVASFLSLF